MKLPNEILDPFLAQTALSMKLAIGSFATWMATTNIPEGHELAKIASATTGWGLAIACIWSLTKAVRVLFLKIEEKDKAIQALNDIAVSKAEAQRTEMLNELKLMNERNQR
jgi:hypothetical protein